MRTWDPKVENAIGRAVVAGVPTMTIYRQVLSGELDGIERGYEMPRSTYMQTLARVRKRLLEALEPKSSKGRGGRPTLADLEDLENDDALITRLTRQERERESEPAPLAIPTGVSVGGPQPRPAQARRDQVIAKLEAKLEALAESAG